MTGACSLSISHLTHPSGVADEYMEEIPSVVVDPMPEDIAKLAQVSAPASFPCRARGCVCPGAKRCIAAAPGVCSGFLAA